VRIFNHKYINDETLSTYIEKNGIRASKNILIQIFSGTDEEEMLKNICGKIKEILPGASIIGTTTAGEIIEGEMIEHETVISFSLFNTTRIKSKLYQNDNEELCAKRIVEDLISHDTKALILFSDGLQSNGEEIIKQIAMRSPQIIIAGGRAGDNQRFEKSFVFNERSVAQNGFAAASLSGDDLIAHNRYIFGWESIGKAMVVTKADKNRLFAINDINASEMYEKYLGKEIFDFLPEAGIEFPLIAKRGDICIARVPVAKMEDGSLLFAGNLNEGENVRFGFGNIEMVIEKNLENYEYFRSFPIEASYIYSCIGRKALLGDELKSEFGMLESIAPTVGFFTYGEFFHSQSANELLNITTTVLSLSEAADVPKREKYLIKKETKNRTLSALSHLASATSKELEVYSNSLQERIEDEIEKRKEQEAVFIHQSRLVSMGEMIGNIAHQWRQPLNALNLVIGNMGDLFKLGRLDDAYMKKSTEKAYRLIQGMSNTIDDFRNFFRPDKTKKIFSPKASINDSLELLDGVLKYNGIKAEKKFEENLLTEGYQNEFSQAIVNIINNAKDALVEKKIKNPVIVIELKELNGKIHIQIEDNAGGIPEPLIGRIFEPYFTTKEQGMGTGIGLYMSKMIIEEHMHGMLSVKNGKRGAIFTIMTKSVKNA